MTSLSFLIISPSQQCISIHLCHKSNHNHDGDRASCCDSLKKNTANNTAGSHWFPFLLGKYMQKDPSKTIEYLISHTGGLQKPFVNPSLLPPACSVMTGGFSQQAGGGFPSFLFTWEETFPINTKDWDNVKAAVQDFERPFKNSSSIDYIKAPQDSPHPDSL